MPGPEDPESAGKVNTPGTRWTFDGPGNTVAGLVVVIAHFRLCKGPHPYSSTGNKKYRIRRGLLAINT